MHIQKYKGTPSPRSRNAKKPLINLTTLQTYSLDRIKNTQKSQKTMNTFRSLDKNNSNITQKENYHNPHLTSPNASSQYPAAHSYSNTAKCVNHSQRNAVLCSQQPQSRYYCFQCSLYQARKGSKVVHIHSQPQPATPIVASYQQPSNNCNKQSRTNSREQTIKHYLKKSSQLQKTLTNHIKDLKKSINSQLSAFQTTIQHQTLKLKWEIKQLQTRSNKKISLIQNLILEEAEKYKIICQQLQNFILCNRLNRIDIIKNYQDCLNFNERGFEDKDYVGIMREYWLQVQESLAAVGKYSVGNAMLELEQKWRLVENVLEGRSPNMNQFTFSKDRRYESPNWQKISKMQGVPMISSKYSPGQERNREQIPRYSQYQKQSKETNKIKLI